LVRRKSKGRKPYLTAEQQQRLLQILANGAKQHGFFGDFWTRDRVDEVIWREFGIRYAKRHIGQLLKRLGWHLQPPSMPMLQRAQRFAQWQAEFQVLLGNAPKQS
jgi:transposase